MGSIELPLEKVSPFWNPMGISSLTAFREEANKKHIGVGDDRVLLLVNPWSVFSGVVPPKVRVTVEWDDPEGQPLPTAPLVPPPQNP